MQKKRKWKQIRKKPRSFNYTVIGRIDVPEILLPVFFWTCGFIPLFSPEPHGSLYFHVSGVHYFTTIELYFDSCSSPYCIFDWWKNGIRRDLYFLFQEM